MMYRTFTHDDQATVTNTTGSRLTGQFEVTAARLLTAETFTYLSHNR
jgi:hypothetical protein